MEVETGSEGISLMPVLMRFRQASQAQVKAWSKAWPRAKAVAMEVEVKVRLLARPWGEAWTKAEAMEAEVWEEALEEKGPAWAWAWETAVVEAQRERHPLMRD